MTGCRLAAQRLRIAAVEQADQPAGRAIALNEGNNATPAEELAGDVAETLLERNHLRRGIAFGEPVSQPVGTAANAPTDKRPGCDGLRTGQRGTDGQQGQAGDQGAVGVLPARLSPAQLGGQGGVVSENGK